MPFEAINPPQFPTPIAPYSAGAKAGNTVYVSGVLALGEGGCSLFHCRGRCIDENCHRRSVRSACAGSSLRCTITQMRAR